MFDCLTDTQIKFIIAISTLILGGFIGFYFGRKNIRYQHFLLASAEFRKVFVDMIAFLEKSRDESIIIDKLLSDTDSTYDFIVKNIDTQKRAYINFSHYLGRINRNRFSKAWEDYANPKHKDKQGIFDWVSRISVYRVNEFSKEKDVRELVRKKINKLLSFAKAR